MNSLPTATAEIIRPERAGSFQRQLEAALGLRFRRLGIDGDHLAAEDFPFTSDQLDRACTAIKTDGFALQSVQDHQTAILLPAEAQSSHELLIGIVDTTDHDLLQRLVNTTQRLVQSESRYDSQSSDMNSCLEMLSDNLEEQTWLRTLSEQMRLCDLSLDVTNVAHELLTSLKGLIRAESVALFQGDYSSSDCAAQSSVVWVGRPLAIDDCCGQWLKDSLVGDKLTRTHVSNGDRVDERLRLQGVKSLLAVPLLSSSKPRGWLVAINRTPLSHDPNSALRFSESEFGTIEASIAEAAAALIATHSHNVDLLDEQAELILAVIRSISSAIDARDPYTRGHSERVARYARRIAGALGRPEPECQRFYVCGLLHDVGKIGVPDHVLQKPGRLTDDEFDAVKKHPEIGYRIVKNLTPFNDLLPGILHHHEAVDGSGYPHALCGDDIPFQARVMAVADAYDAMTSNRPYRDGMSHEKAAGILHERAGIQWDAEIVAAFLQVPEEDRLWQAGTPGESDISYDCTSERTFPLEVEDCHAALPLVDHAKAIKHAEPLLRSSRL